MRDCPHSGSRVFPVAAALAVAGNPNHNRNTFTQMKQYILTPLLVLLLAACSTVAPGHDPVLVNAQRTITSSHAAIDFAFKTERDNETWVLRFAPAVHTAMNSIRRTYPKAETSAWAAVETYRVNRTADNKANLDTWLATLQKLVDEATTYATQINSGTNP